MPPTVIEEQPSGWWKFGSPCCFACMRWNDQQIEPGSTLEGNDAYSFDSGTLTLGNTPQGQAYLAGDTFPAWAVGKLDDPYNYAKLSVTKGGLTTNYDVASRVSDTQLALDTSDDLSGRTPPDSWELTLNTVADLLDGTTPEIAVGEIPTSIAVLVDYELFNPTITLADLIADGLAVPRQDDWSGVAARVGGAWDPCGSSLQDWTVTRSDYTETFNYMPEVFDNVLSLPVVLTYNPAWEVPLGTACTFQWPVRPDSSVPNSVDTGESFDDSLVDFDDLNAWLGGNDYVVEVATDVGVSRSGVVEARVYYIDSTTETAYTYGEMCARLFCIDCATDDECIGWPDDCDTTDPTGPGYVADSHDSKDVRTVSVSAANQYAAAQAQFGSDAFTPLTSGTGWIEAGLGLDFSVEISSFAWRAVQETFDNWDYSQGSDLAVTLTAGDPSVYETYPEPLFGWALRISGTLEPPFPTDFNQAFGEEMTTDHTDDPVHENPPAGTPTTRYRGLSIEMLDTATLGLADSAHLSNQFRYRGFLESHADHDPANGRYVLAFAIKPIRNYEPTKTGFDGSPEAVGVSQKLRGDVPSLSPVGAFAGSSDYGHEYICETDAEEECTRFGASLNPYPAKGFDAELVYGYVGIQINGVNLSPGDERLA